MSDNTLDLAVLGTVSGQDAIVFARFESDVAVAHLPNDADLIKLTAFRERISSALLMNQTRPTKGELATFGQDLFKYLVRDDAKELYDQLPRKSPVRINFLTNRTELQSIPWEYMLFPGQGQRPLIDRSIARIVPTHGIPKYEPSKIRQNNKKIRILFVYADPVNQDPVSWPSVRKSIENVFMSKIPTDYEMTIVEGTLEELFNAFQNDNDQYEIFQFSGHGDVDPQTGEGRILLLSRNGQQAQPFPASDLAMLLRGRGIRLAVLSACLTGAGNSGDPFNVIAEALVRNKIPAVVANQLPVPDDSVATFLGPLYSHLLTTGDIDVAVTEGRIRLAGALSAMPSAVLEWGIPILYRQIMCSKVFKAVAR